MDPKAEPARTVPPNSLSHPEIQALLNHVRVGPGSDHAQLGQAIRKLHQALGGND